MSTVLSVLIPTYNRRAILVEALRRLEGQTAPPEFEVVVVDDGSSDDTVDALAEFIEGSDLNVQLVRQRNGGHAVARNTALAHAHHDVCLFLGDDMWAHPDLLARHARFHAEHPERVAALLGSARWAPELDTSPFVEWLHRGIQFDFDSIETPDDVPPQFFYTANISLKTRFVRDVGGFDEAFAKATHEDIELGFRLEAAGMRLYYDAEARVDHYHPTSIATTLERMTKVADGNRLLIERVPSWPEPRRPGLRHRVRAGALTVATALTRARSVREQAWAFVCHEALRESYWGKRPADRPLLIGSRLLGRAEREEATWLRRTARG